MNKDLYYEKMKPYFDQKIVREVYSSDHICILNIGESNYIASSYILFDGDPVGLYVDTKTVKEIAENNGFFLALQKVMMSNPIKYQKLIYDLSEERINDWKTWIANEKEKGNSEIDHDLEAELASLSKGMSR